MNEQDYQKWMQQITLSPEEKERMINRLQKTRKVTTRPKVSAFKKKRSILAVACMLFLAIPVGATGLICNWNSHSSSIPDYPKLPTVEQCRQDAGFTPVIMQTLGNGYQFTQGNLIANTLKDDHSHTVQSFRSFSFDYTKGKDQIIFSQEPYTPEPSEHADILSNVQGTNIYYSVYQNKFVPPDYSMTEEDQAAEAAGELVFSWGSDQVEICTVQNVFWQIDTIHYSLLQIDGELLPQDLANIAEEIILHTPTV